MNNKLKLFKSLSNSEFFEKEKEYNLNFVSRKFLDSKKGYMDTVVLEGVHAFKHAFRFGDYKKEMLFVFMKDKKEALRKLEKVIPDEIGILEEISVEISEEEFEELSAQKLNTDILVLALKKEYNIEDIFKNENNPDKAKPIVFLENAADLGNIGSALRGATAFGVEAYVTCGRTSIWHQKVIKTAVGLQYATPVFWLESFEEFREIMKKNNSKRIIISADERGENIKKTKIPKNSVIIFGAERQGIKQETKKLSDRIISLPMQPKVSSLNLATSVVAFLYGADFE